MLNSNYIWIIGMCLITLVIMLVIMPGLIDYLHKIKFGQTEREEGLASHKNEKWYADYGWLSLYYCTYTCVCDWFFLYTIQIRYEHND